MIGREKPKRRSQKRLLLLILLFVNGITVFAQSPSWGRLSTGANGSILAQLEFNGSLYAGGAFTTIGGVGASRVAKWNGSSWSPVGNGLNGTVAALAVYNGELYAGGRFELGSSTNIAKWNGSNWVEVPTASGGSLIDGVILTLAVHNGELYAGGEFSQVGDATIVGIAKYDGNTWSSLGSGSMDAGVFSLLSYQGKLVVGGMFTHVGNTPAKRIATWDGQWHSMGSGLDGNVYALEAWNGSLYVGTSIPVPPGCTRIDCGETRKDLHSGGGEGENPIGGEKYHFPNPNAPIREFICPSIGEICPPDNNATKTLVVWNGQNFQAVGGGTGGSVLSLEVFNNKLYVGGYFFEAGGLALNNMASWNGTNWEDVGHGMNDQVWSLCTYPSNSPGAKLYASGLFTTASNFIVNYIARYPVTEAPFTDIGVSSVGFSESGCSELVQTSVTNYGTEAVGSFTIHVVGTGANPVDKTLTVTAVLNTAQTAVYDIMVRTKNAGLTDYTVTVTAANDNTASNNTFQTNLNRISYCNTSVFTISPDRNASNIAANSPIQITYTDPILPATANAATIRIYGSQSGLVSGTFALSNGNKTVTFSPASPFIFGESINVISTNQVIDEFNQPVNAHTSEFLVKYLPSPGVLTAPVDYGTGDFPRMVSAGDLNGDGFNDLVVSNKTGNTISVLINNVNNPGSFLPKADYASGNAPYDIQIADFDYDNDMDVAVANETDGTVSVYLNNGNGTLGAKTDYATYGQPIGYLEAKDINMDGRVDLITANKTTERSSVLYSNGDGTFASHIDLYSGHGISSADAVDIDNDGDHDVMIANFWKYISSNKNNGGSLIPAVAPCGQYNCLYSVWGVGHNGQSRAVWTDLNNDRKVDFIGTMEVDGFNTAHTMMNLGAYLSNPVNYVLGNKNRFIAAADMDGDGDQDLLGTHEADNHHNVIALLRNDGMGIFSPAERYHGRTATVQGLFVADLNNDGTGELIVANGSTPSVSVFRNLVNASELSGHVFGDLNQNGIQEATEANIPNFEVTVYPNDYKVLTDANGNYTFHIGETGSYAVSALGSAEWIQTLPVGNAVYSRNVVLLGEDHDHLEFGIVHSPNGCECLDVQVTRNPTPLTPEEQQIVDGTADPTICPPDFCATWKVVVTNNCATTMGNFKIDFNFDAPQCLQSTAIQSEAFTNCTPPNNITSIVTTTPYNANVFSAVHIEKSPAALPVGCSYEINIQGCFEPGLCAWGTPLGAYVVASANNGNCLSLNEDVNPAACSWDPNNIEMHPEGCGVNGFIPAAEELEFHINFQNTGNFAARDVVVFNYVDPALFDYSTFELENSSFPVQYQFVGNHIEFTFDEIYLADSTSNEQASHGWVEYSIKPFANLAPGTQLQTSADIFFDQNPAVPTNMTLNTISIDPAPVASITGDVSLCSGESTTLTASQGTYYLWSNGATTRSITVSESGSYYVTVYYEHSCESFASIDVVVHNSLSASISNSNPSLFTDCGVTSSVLNSSVTGGTAPYTYLWSTGATTASITVAPTKTTTYTLTITDGNGCTASSTVTVAVTNISCGNGKVLVCHKSTGNPPTTICVAKSSLPQHFAHGDYCGPCQANKSADEESAVSEEIIDATSGILIQPNPNNGSFTLSGQMASEDAGIDIIILDAKGVQMKQFKLNSDKSGKFTTEIHADEFASGIYFVRVLGKNESLMERLNVVK